jgi:hypothetical protein
VDRNRLAHLHGLSRAETLLHLNTLPPRFVAALFNPRSVTARAVGTVEGLTGFEDLNREEFRVVEIPAGNGISTARSVAKAYGAVATGGSDLGMTATTVDALVNPAVPPTNGLRGKVLHVDTAFSLGFSSLFLSSRSVRTIRRLEPSAPVARSGSPIRVPALDSPM